MIEWAEKLGHHLPASRIDVEMEIAGEGALAPRRARLVPHGAWEGRPIGL